MQKATLGKPSVMFIVGAAGHGWYSRMESKVKTKDWKKARENRDFVEKTVPPEDNSKAK